MKPTSLSTILGTILGALSSALTLLAGTNGHIEHAGAGTVTLASLVGLLNIAGSLLIHPNGTTAPAVPAIPDSARTPDGATPATLPETI